MPIPGLVGAGPGRASVASVASGAPALAPARPTAGATGVKLGLADSDDDDEDFFLNH